MIGVFPRKWNGSSIVELVGGMFAAKVVLMSVVRELFLPFDRPPSMVLFAAPRSFTVITTA